MTRETVFEMFREYIEAEIERRMVLLLKPLLTETGVDHRKGWGYVWTSAELIGLLRTAIREKQVTIDASRKHFKKLRSQYQKNTLPLLEFVKEQKEKQELCSE